MFRSANVPPGYRPNVGMMLIGPDRRVFVGQRLDTRMDAWQMPQGGIDRGETPERAALRELAEEIGTAKAELLRMSADWFAYDLPTELARTMWKCRYRGQAQKWAALRFTGVDDDIRLDTAHPEFRSWRWARASELPSLIVPFKRDVYSAVVREFADLVD
ncbi:MAG: RNA pyrophosphohydrolase [Alphaproteobacteria bacterium]|nr:RNA pyrophosphohydrolase [Alphaproteobacteria bacterium]